MTFQGLITFMRKSGRPNRHDFLGQEGPDLGFVFLGGLIFKYAQFFAISECIHIELTTYVCFEIEIEIQTEIELDTDFNIQIEIEIDIQIENASYCLQSLYRGGQLVPFAHETRVALS